jgi:acetylglutamate kinase
MNISPHDIARVLSEALPHMQQYDEETVVVKYGGHAMGEEELAKSFARDIVLMEQTAGRRSARCSSGWASSRSSPAGYA